MTRTETFDLLTTMKASVVNFHIDPSKAVSTWHKILSDFSVNEAVGALNDITGSSDVPPTPHRIKEWCQHRRYRERKQQENQIGDLMMRQADESFRNVPGSNRGEQVVRVVAQRAAEHWIGGNRNEFFGDILLQGKALGIEFDGIDYSRIQNSGNGMSDGFLKMARGLKEM